MTERGVRKDNKLLKSIQEQIARFKFIEDIDQGLVAMLAYEYRLYKKACEELEKGNLYDYNLKTGKKVPSVYFMMKESAVKNILNISNKLGLLPKERNELMKAIGGVGGDGDDDLENMLS